MSAFDMQTEIINTVTKKFLKNLNSEIIL